MTTSRHNTRCTGDQGEWAKWVPLVQYALRTTPREETGLTPFFCVYGREARFPLDVGAGGVRGSLDLGIELQRMMQNMQLAEESIGRSLNKRARQIERRNDRVQHTLSVAVGDFVWIRKPAAPGRAASLDDSPGHGSWWRRMESQDSRSSANSWGRGCVTPPRMSRT